MFNKVISILGTLILLVLAGCRDVAPISVEEPSTENRTITLNLDITTRADATSEQSPENFHLWIFSGNKLLKYINNNPTWQESKDNGIDLKAKVETEIDATGITKIQFYLLLNTKVEAPWNMTPNQLKTLTFTETSYSHDNKVPMSGEQTLEIKSNQYNYTVEIDAVRSVAKLGIYCTKSNSASTLVIKQITLGNIPVKGYLFEAPDDKNIDYTVTFLSFKGEINESYTGAFPGNFEKFEEIEKTSFTQVYYDYLQENLNGDEDIQIVDNEIADNKRYYIKLEYTLNGLDDEKIIYLSQMKRNLLSKIYIRINDATTINTCCQINSWTDHKMDVPAFE